MARGDIKHMSMHDFLVFLFLLLVVAALGSFVLARVIRSCLMSPEEIEKETGTKDMVEMQNLLTERQWRADESMILLPRGC